MPPTTFSLFCSTAALRIGVADFSLATLSITFCQMAFLSVSAHFGSTALTAGAMAVTRDGICPGSGNAKLSINVWTLPLRKMWTGYGARLWLLRYLAAYDGYTAREAIWGISLEEILHVY
jgi:hypothetical protein